MCVAFRWQSLLPTADIVHSGRLDFSGMRSLLILLDCNLGRAIWVGAMAERNFANQLYDDVIHGDGGPAKGAAMSFTAAPQTLFARYMNANC